MSDDWRTNGPEVGQLATIIDEYGTYRLARFTKNGWSLNDKDFLSNYCVLKWKPIITPEEIRMRDLLRWRDAKKELPRDSKFYLVSSCRDPSSVVCDYFDHLDRKWINTNVKFWRPLGPDPGEGGE